MSIASNRRVINQFSGDYDLTAVNAAAENDTSPGSIFDYSLSSGNNTITPPTGAVGGTLIMPSGNTVLITLKGVNGDTGVALHKTDPTSLGLNTNSAFVLSAASTVDIKIIWS